MRETLMMGDGNPLRHDDPDLMQLKRVEMEGDLDPRNPAANMVPPDHACAEAVARLASRGCGPAMHQLLLSTLMLNLWRRKLGQKSLALQPLDHNP